MSTNKVIICAISDLHGMLPADGIIPSCHLLLIAGDICPDCRAYTHRGKAIEQRWWVRDVFAPWLEKQPCKQSILVWGNHDWIGQYCEPAEMPQLPCTVLTDVGVERFGLQIWGSPWQPPFFDWAFNLSEVELAKKWSLIPAHTDILVTHSPPYMYGDLAPSYGAGRRQAEHVGSPTLLRRVLEVRPQLHVFGHIHEGRGLYDIIGTKAANVTLVDGQYNMIYQPFVTELEVPMTELTNQEKRGF